MGCGGVVQDAFGPIKGRGTANNIVNRFEQVDYVPDDEHGELDATRPKTVFFYDRTKSIISTNDSPDIGVVASINPYRGCEHGCIYCYARPYHEYLGFSAGLDYETKIVVKQDAAKLLEAEMASARWTPKAIALSGGTDPYQPAERHFRITRQCLGVLRDFRNPVGIITKNRLVLRDIDILKEMSAHDCAAVFVSVTTLDLNLNRVLEPRTSSPAQRLDTIRQLAQAGIPTGVMVAPIIPALNDHEIASIVAAAVDAGASLAGKVVVRLPHAVAPLFEQWLEQHFPDRKDKVLNRIREMRSGKLNDPNFGTRMRGVGIYADQIDQVFGVACRKAGIAGNRANLSTAHFRRPVLDNGQLPLFP